MGTTDGPRHAPRAITRLVRWKVVRFVLAGGVLLGAGAAASSAAWTNAAVFKSAASTGSVDLWACSSANPGAPTPTWTCEAADAANTAHTILSSAAFSLMVPGNTYTTTVRLENRGTVPLSVTSVITPLAEPLMGTAPNATLSVAPAGPTTVPSLGNQILTITVTTPSNWDPSHANKSSTAALQIVSTGTTIPTS